MKHKRFGMNKKILTEMSVGLILLALAVFFCLSAAQAEPAQPMPTPQEPPASQFPTAPLSPSSPLSLDCQHPLFKNYKEILTRYDQNAGKVIKESSENISNLGRIEFMARMVALFATFVCALSVAVLAGIALWKLMVRWNQFRGNNILSSEQMTAARSTILGWCLLFSHLYFVTVLVVVFLSHAPIKRQVMTFREKLAHAGEFPPLGEQANLAEIQRFMQILQNSFQTVTDSYAKNSKELPGNSRWWSLGWDGFYMVQFERTAVEAVQTRFLRGQESIKVILPKLSSACSAPTTI